MTSRATRISRLSSVFSLLMLSACSGGGDGQPTAPPAGVATVAVALAQPSLQQGLTTQATAVLRSATGVELTGRAIAWSTSAAGVATVSASGLVTAVGVGTATITATSEGRSGSAALTVVPVAVASVIITLPSNSMFAGTTAQASAEARSGSGAPLTGRTITWSSSQSTVATVSATTGLITAVAAGTTNITATSEGRVGTVTLTVNPTPVASISFPAANINVSLRARSQLIPTLRDADGNVLTGRTISYQSSAPTIVSVTTTGEVRSLLPGVADITATVEGRTATVRVNGSLAELSAIVDAIRQEHGMPAMGGAIVHAEGLIGLGVSGTRRAGGGAVVSVDDKWHIGSNTKALTGMLAGMAVEAGVITWQRTIEQGFPDLAATMLPAHRAVPLVELLSNTAGLVNTLQGLTATTNTVAARVEWANATLSTAPYGPRGQYYYSNNGFGIAATIIERAWASNYEALMSSRIFQPLGLTDAGWGPTSAPGGAQPQGHRLQGGAWITCEGCDNPPGVSAAGTAHMSLRSWSRIMQELLLADQGRSTMLTQNTARFLTTVQVPNATTGSRYGIGWQLPAGQRQAAHDGSNTFNHSRAWLYLDAGLGFLMTINAADLDGGRTGAALSALQTRMNSYWTNGQ